jgi:PAS domain S-box-containing protein
MVMISQTGLIEMVNAQAERVFGYVRKNLLGQPIEMLVPERFRRVHPGLRGSFFSAPVSRPMGVGRDLFGLKADGTEFPIEIGLNPIETDEGSMVLSAIVDISDRKHKEQSIHAALKEKDVLLGEIYHRVKNNLQIVHSLLGLQSSNIGDEIVLGMMRESQNRIRSMALRPELKVLYTTGYARNAIVHHGRLDPGVELITKPFTCDDLATRVREILDRRDGANQERAAR